MKWSRDDRVDVLVATAVVLVALFVLALDYGWIGTDQVFDALVGIGVVFAAAVGIHIRYGHLKLIRETARVEAARHAPVGRVLVGSHRYTVDEPLGDRATVNVTVANEGDEQFRVTDIGIVGRWQPVDGSEPVDSERVAPPVDPTILHPGGRVKCPISLAPSNWPDCADRVVFTDTDVEGSATLVSLRPDVEPVTVRSDFMRIN